MNKTVVIGIIVILVVLVLIGVVFIKNNGTQPINTGTENTNTNNVSVEEWKTFETHAEFSRGFAFEVPQNWEYFIGPSSGRGGTAFFVPQSAADFEGHIPPQELVVLDLGLWIDDQSYVTRFRGDDSIIEESSKEISIDGYIGEVLEWRISRENSLGPGPLGRYVANGEESSRVKILYLPSIDYNNFKNGEFTLLMKSSLENSDEIFDHIVSSIDFK